MSPLEIDLVNAEHLARRVAGILGVELGPEMPATEFLEAHPEATAEATKDDPDLAASVARAIAHWNAPISPEDQLSAVVVLTPEQWARMQELIDHPPPPTEALIRLLRGDSPKDPSCPE